jgi:hypothetical protein
MPTQAEDKEQLNARVDRSVMRLLDRQLARERRAGRKVTKERLVADAIVAAYQEPTDADWLPVHRGVFTAELDPGSNSALLDFADQAEALNP